jgi:peroxiredoxin
MVHPRALLAAVLALAVVTVAARSTVAAAPAAPAFRVKLLDSGKVLDSRDLLGKKVVVVRFQASWCRPCVRESAALARLAERYGERGVDVVALHVQDAAADVRRFMHANAVTYPVALDPKLAVGNRFGVKGTPYTVVIDRKGEIVARLPGASALGQLPKILDTALAARPSRKL